MSQAAEERAPYESSEDKEKSRKRPFRPDSLLDGTRFNALGVLGRKLCVMSWVVTNSVYEVWVMEDYGVAESWVKRHVFSQFSVAGSFGFTLHDEFLVEDNEDRFVLYDPNANKTKMFKEFDYDINPYRADKVVNYVDSLVWVAPVKHETVDGAGPS
ncbi:unnamed protein product [Lactuca virosa]|uniref:F-box associated domain-containing protein n=1 Tax=Lactuca virosa TaxID=75947 RepID=A0AAU9N7T3_9ASTR|nr:unnamed protein product [Lactuca virosa]